MNLNDALTITVLGIGVVFIGLILTSLMIYSFSLFPKLSGYFKKTDAQHTAVENVPTGQHKIKEKMPPVEPEVVAVITSVLEVELRLRASLME
jgi:Na+-transporting methylmalonyl-CoA/oxaloacetate decarboxylase gamma subunit